LEGHSGTVFTSLSTENADTQAVVFNIPEAVRSSLDKLHFSVEACFLSYLKAYEKGELGRLPFFYPMAVDQPSLGMTLLTNVSTFSALA